eukprot:scaffold434_cov186-Pinguiococcus_pyrenoidosus.AAC.126
MLDRTPLRNFFRSIVARDGDVKYCEFSFCHEDQKALKRAVNSVCKQPIGELVTPFRGKGGGGLNVGRQKTKLNRRSFCFSVVLLLKEMLLDDDIHDSEYTAADAVLEVLPGDHGQVEEEATVPTSKAKALKTIKTILERHGHSIAEKVFELSARHMRDGLGVQNRLRVIINKIDEELTSCSKELMRSGASYTQA